MQINPWDGKNFGAASVRQQVETSLNRLKVIIISIINNIITIIIMIIIVTVIIIVTAITIVIIVVIIIVIIITMISTNIIIVIIIIIRRFLLRLLLLPPPSSPSSSPLPPPPIPPPSSPSWGTIVSQALCSSVCSPTSLISSTPLGIVSGWAGGDTRSVKNFLFLYLPYQSRMREASTISSN